MSKLVKTLLIGCGALLVLGFGGCVAFFWYVMDEPEGISVSVEVPGQMTVGESFEIVARVANEGDRMRELVDLDIADEYLEGFVISAATPEYNDSMHVPIDNSVSYGFDLAVPAASEVLVIFDAEAVQAGDFAGDFDFCIDSEVRCLSAFARTVVSEAP